GRECRRRRGRKSQADTQSLAIVKRERCLDATELTLLECFAVPPPEPEQQSFNVLTGPQRIDREIGAGAIVLEQPWAAQGNPVGLVAGGAYRSEEHTSELQSRENLVCRLLLEKKKTNNHNSR